MSVLIPDGETWDAVKVLRCFSGVPGIRAHVLSKSKSSLSLFSRFCSSYHRHESENDDDWIRTIRDLVRKLKIDVVLPVTQIGVEFVARNRDVISEFVTLAPVSDYELVTMCQDKWLFHDFARQHGFPVPATVNVGEAGRDNVTLNNLDSVEFPALLKPRLLDGGTGIVRVNEASDFHHTWQNGRVVNACQYILQSVIPGVVFCLNLYSHAGEMVAYTLWKTLLSSRKRSYFSARAMEYVTDAKIVDLANRLISTLGWDGIANIDFLVDTRDESMVILDFNPRFGQSLLGSLMTGVNFPLLACLGAKGMEYPHMYQRDHTIYAHPAIQAKMLMSRLFGRRPPVRVRWREGSLQFTLRDPLPELIDAFR